MEGRDIPAFFISKAFLPEAIDIRIASYRSLCLLVFTHVVIGKPVPAFP